MTLNYILIGKRIKELRKKKYISQAQLAELTGKSPNYIGYLERGLKSMSLETLVAVANALKVTADEILDDCLDEHLKVDSNEYSTLFADCSPYERSVILEGTKALKKAIREYSFLFRKFNR